MRSIERNLPQAIIIIVFLMTYSTVVSQTICFNYDENGNRIRREICITDVIEVKSTDSILKQLTQKLSLQENDELLAGEISVFPNPTDGKLNISYNGSFPTECTEVFLYSISGQEVMENNFCGKEKSYDLSYLSPGTYMLLIKSGGRKTKWKIIIK
jgi:hypothetical protein